MQSYQPNTLLSGRFLLKEQLSYDAAAGQQVWTVTDTQTGKALIARIHAGGHIDWYNDNRPTATEIEPAAVPPPPARDEAPPVTPVKPAAVPLPQTGRTRKSGGILFFLLLAVSGILGYYNQDLVNDQINAIKSQFQGESDSLATTVAESPASPVPASEKKLFGQNGGLPVWEPEATEPAGQPAAAGNVNTSTGPAEAVRAQFRTISATDPYAEISAPDFDKAAALLRQLRQSGGYPALCDSVYAIATDRADQFYLGFRNNHSEAKGKAIAWYKISSAAKETAHSKKRLADLQPPPRGKRESSPVTDYFPKDPELNLN